MFNINPVNYISICKVPSFKATPNSCPLSTNETIQNELNGNGALAVYNIGMMNSQRNLDIPVVEQRLRETNVDRIKGEKIYNSKGELLKIIDEQKDVTKEYFIDDNKLLSYKETNKSNNEVYEAYYGKDQSVSVSNSVNDNIVYSADYDSNGNIIYKEKYTYDKQGNDLIIGYDYQSQEYDVSRHFVSDGNVSSSFATFDKNKQCISADNMNSVDNTFQYVDFYNNQPYKITNCSEKVINNNIFKADINLENLEPHTYKEFNLEDIIALDGEKSYYSNGNLEKVITSDGTEFKIDMDKRSFSVKQGNTEMFYEKNILGEWNKPVVKEILNNGAQKQTSYSDNDSKEVLYEDGNIHRAASFSPNGSVSSYSEQVDGKIKDLKFDEDGNLIDAWYSKLDN